MRLRHHLPFSCLPVTIKPPPHIETTLFPRFEIIVNIHHNAKWSPKMMRTRPVKVNVRRVNMRPQFRLFTPNFVYVYSGCIRTRHCTCKSSGNWKPETGNGNYCFALSEYRDQTSCPNRLFLRPFSSVDR